MRGPIIIIFSIILILSSASLLFAQYQNKEEIILLEKNKERLLSENRGLRSKIDFLETENKNLEEEILRLEEERRRKEEEKIKKESWEKWGIKDYSYGHQIINDSKYIPIKISDEYRGYFVILKVREGDTYASLVSKVFKTEKNKPNIEEYKKLNILAEKINRVGKKHISPGMELVIPRSLEALNFAPFTRKISDEEFGRIKEERDKLVSKYWSDFGSDWGNKFFQKRASRDWHHILIIDLDSQYFGIYNDRELVDWGPISSGREGFETTRGYYISLWQKDDWYSFTYDAPMPNAVNFTTNGLFTHQGVLPGYPQSHGCPRMLENDSRKIYDISLKEVFPIIVR